MSTNQVGFWSCFCLQGAMIRNGHKVDSRLLMKRTLD